MTGSNSGYSLSLSQLLESTLDRLVEVWMKPKPLKSLLWGVDLDYYHYIEDRQDTSINIRIHCS